MSVALSRPMTPDEFFRWAETQDWRYEFDGERPVAMTGGSARHGRVVGNVFAGLKVRLRGRRCEVFPSEGPGVATIGGRIRYPDATVTCSRIGDRDQLIENPVVVFEVVSEGNARTDRLEKMREYHAAASIRRHVLVEQSAPVLVSYAREGDEPWTATSLTVGDTLAMPEIGIEMPVADIFENLEFETEQDDARA